MRTTRIAFWVAGSLMLLPTLGSPLENRALASPAVLSENYDVADEYQPHGRIASITPAELQAILSASNELRTLSLDPDKYKSIHIRETQRYFYVVFSPLDEGSTASGDLPSAQAGIEMQIDRQTLQLRGTKRGR
jgi:hypothetical protein